MRIFSKLVLNLGLLIKERRHFACAKEPSDSLKLSDGYVTAVAFASYSSYFFPIKCCF